MKTIKFRGRVIENEILWRYGSLITYPNGDCAIVEFDNYGNELSYDVDVYTVGQFTGLKDKNGKEIYEGDIIGCHNPDIKHLIFYNEKQARFMAALNGNIENVFIGVCGLDDSRWNASKEVVGNIHDNPVLLKGGEV